MKRPLSRPLDLPLIFLLLLVLGQAAGANNNALPGESTMPHFPTVKAANLEGRDFTIPHDLEGELNLLFVAFERRQQEDVDTWLPHARQLCQTDSRLRSYELPTIRRGNPVMRWMINHGMASGIHDPQARASTITLYLDKEDFRAALGIEQEDEITILLIKRDGSIRWRSQGTWSAEKEGSLRRALLEENAGRATTP
jgi:hypothetical protein